MVAFLPIIGAAMGLVGVVGKAIERGKANKELKKFQAQDPVRQRSGVVDQQYGMAQQLLNAADPYEQEAQRMAVTRFGNTTANIAKGATDASQFLAANAAATGQLQQDQAEVTAGSQDAYYQNLQNLQQAAGAVQQEDQNQFADQVRRFEDKGQIQGAIAQNKAATWGDIGNFGMGLASMGISAKANGVDIFGKKKQTTS